MAILDPMAHRWLNVTGQGAHRLLLFPHRKSPESGLDPDVQEHFLLKTLLIPARRPARQMTEPKYLVVVTAKFAIIGGQNYLVRSRSL
uniref:Uncharacterized protein n=1 Tax=Bionectria ochroleuca TaxID=29856 RepID=A0A0B7JR92_BIOOC